MQCVILAGGLGTRMFPLTEKIPKILLNINNTPFIDYQLNYLCSQGITNVVLCIGHLGHKIKDYINNSKFNLDIDFVDEGENLLGTAGAIKLASDKLKDNFFVIYGDSFLPINLSNIYKYYINNNLKALMTVYYNNNCLDKSNVILYDDKSILYNKNHSSNEFKYIDYGLSILSKDIFDQIQPNQKYKLSDLFKELSLKKSIFGYEVHERFYEIGSFSGLKDFENYIKPIN